MISISKKQRLLFGGLLASVALAASAQTPPPIATDKPANATQAAPAAPRMQRGDPGKRHEQMQQRRTQRLAALKEKLKLDAAQEPAWNSFATAQQPPQRTGQRPSRDDIAKLTTPQRLDLMQQRQAERSAAFAKRADATRSFYAALKPEQQQVFDAETLRAGPPHGGRQHPHGPHGQSAPAKS
jgi:hypothetical protein